MYQINRTSDQMFIVYISRSSCVWTLWSGRRSWPTRTNLCTRQTARTGRTCTPCGRHDPSRWRPKTHSSRGTTRDNVTITGGSREIIIKRVNCASLRDDYITWTTVACLEHVLRRFKWHHPLFEFAISNTTTIWSTAIKLFCLQDISRRSCGKAHGIWA